jgi:hypothetical protein
MIGEGYSSVASCRRIEYPNGCHRARVFKLPSLRAPFPKRVMPTKPQPRLRRTCCLRGGNQGEIRIASPKSVPKEQCRCLTQMFSIASLVVPEI